MQVRAGDLAGVQAVDAQHALKGDKDALAAVGRHYDNGDVMVMQAVLSGSGDQRSIQLTTARYSSGFSDQNWVSSLKSDPKESDDDFFARPVAAVVADGSEGCQKAPLHHTGDE